MEESQGWMDGVVGREDRAINRGRDTRWAPFEGSSLLLPRSSQYRFAPGTTPVLSQTVVPLTLELVEETVQAMDVE